MPRSPTLSAEMRAESRGRLIDASRRLFAERGYFNTSVTDITVEAGMSPGNLYWHFSSKEDLLKAVLAEGFERLEATTAEIAAFPGPPLAKIDYMVERFDDLYRHQGDFTTILLMLMGHGGPAYLKELGFDMARIGARLHANLGALFAEARARKIVADVDPNTLVMAVFAFFNGLMVTYRDEWGLIPPDVLRATVRRLCGVCAVKEKRK